MWFLKPLPICLASVGSRSVGFLPSPTVRLDFRLQFVSRRGESRLHLYSTLWNLFRFKGVQEEKLVGFPSLNMIADGIIFFDAEYWFGNSCTLRPYGISQCLCVCIGVREITRGTCASIGYDTLSVCESMNFIPQRVSELPFMNVVQNYITHALLTKLVPCAKKHSS